MEFDCIGLRNPPADIFDAVVEESSLDPESSIVFDQPRLFDRMFDDVDIFLVNTTVPEPVEILFAAGGLIAMDRVGHFVEIEPHEHGAEAEAMVAVEMADENASDDRRRYFSENELSLGPLSRVEEKPFIIPAEQISAVIAEAGRLLTRTT